MTFSYIFDSLILLLDSVIDIAYSCNVEAASGTGSTKLSFIILRIIAISAMTIESTSAAVFIVFIRTFFGFVLGLSSPGGAFLFNN